MIHNWDYQVHGIIEYQNIIILLYFIVSLNYVIFNYMYIYYLLKI